MQYFSLCLKESEENENIYSMIKENANIWLSFNKEDTLLENKARRQNTSPNTENIVFNFENNVGVVDGVLNFGFDPRKGAATNMEDNFIRFAGAGTNMVSETHADQSFTFATWFRVNHWDQYTDNQNNGVIAAASGISSVTQYWYLQSMYTKHGDQEWE